MTGELQAGELQAGELQTSPRLGLHVFIEVTRTSHRHYTPERIK
eukprot:COSAG06_NODE_64263_length_260_cov_0.614907_1_plen_43_part_10